MRHITLTIAMAIGMCTLSTASVQAQPQKTKVTVNTGTTSNAPSKPTAVKNDSRVTTTTANKNTATVANRQSSKTTKKTTSNIDPPTVDRASIMFPSAVDVPEYVSWKRDIYRALDLTKDENAPLYFPVEQKNGQVNLFTLLFQLLNQGKIPAYKVKLDGLEDFSKENRMHFKEFLDDNGIEYEVQGNSIKVESSDIPSQFVTRLNIKETTYYDQNTATFHSRVTAICPVMEKVDNYDFGDMDDFGGDVSDGENVDDSTNAEPTMANEPLKKTAFPLFWVRIEDISTYLSQHMVMMSNYNNAAQCSMADFFDTNRYKGTIYMTTNMQNKVLQEQFANPKDLKKEQDRIEKEMDDFESHLWETPVDSAELARQDSIAALSKSAKKSKTTRTTKTTKAEKADKQEKSSTPKTSSSPRVSVRRQRH